MKNSFLAEIKTVIYHRWKIIAIGAIGMVAIFLLALLIYYLRIVRGFVWADWTGIEEKTLWDLLELLIVPAFLGFSALWINKLIRDNERRRTAERQREEALQHYLDKMSELLIEKELLEKMKDEDESILVVARGRTVSTLRMLDRDRQNILLSFVREANLANHIVKGANLHNSDLRGAYLYLVNLSQADLSGADLREAVLTFANLKKANLLEADLRGANLSGANLWAAVLSGADLSGAILYNVNLRKANLERAHLYKANLGRANLEGANLKGARVSPEQLDQANSLEGATMPDGSIHE